MSKKALDASRLNAFAMDPEDLTIVGFDTDDGPEHPLWDERVNGPLAATMTEDWIAGICEMGILQAVRVRKNGDRVEVVIGRRRVLGARLANREKLIPAGADPIKVPVMLFRATDAGGQAAVVIENEHRVNDSPIVKAQKISRLLNRTNDLAAAARAAAVEPKEAERLLKLLDLADPVMKMVDEGRLATTTALTLIDLPRKDQVEQAKGYIALGVTVTEAKRQQSGRKRKKSGDAAPVRVKRPSTATLRKLAEDEVFRQSVSYETLGFLEWVLGGSASAVPNLSAVLEKLEGGKA